MKKKVFKFLKKKNIIYSTRFVRDFKVKYEID